MRTGSLGDCWLIAACALASRNPTLRAQLMPALPANSTNLGIHLAGLFADGVWRAVYVDDYLPVDASGGVSFAHQLDGSLWLSLLEKAFAKLEGSYYALTAGSMADAFNTLTGFPSFSILLPQHFPCENSRRTAGDELEELEKSDAEDSDGLWRELVQHHRQGSLLGLSTGRLDISADDFVRAGLQPGHAYAIVDVIEVYDPEPGSLLAPAPSPTPDLPVPPSFLSLPRPLCDRAKRPIPCRRLLRLLNPLGNRIGPPLLSHLFTRAGCMRRWDGATAAVD
jgi:hypothetical protein